MSAKRIDSQRAPGTQAPRKRLPLVKRNDVANEDKVRVKAGDMLSKIAVREGVKLSTLRKLNPGLFGDDRAQGDVTFPGDEVVLRSGGSEKGEPAQNRQATEGRPAQQVRATESKAVVRPSTHKLTDVEATGRVPVKPTDIEPPDRFEPPSQKPVITRPPEPTEPVVTRPVEPEEPISLLPPEPETTEPEAPISTRPTEPVSLPPVEPEEPVSTQPTEPMRPANAEGRTPFSAGPSTNLTPPFRPITPVEPTRPTPEQPLGVGPERREILEPRTGPRVFTGNPDIRALPTSPLAQAVVVPPPRTAMPLAPAPAAPARRAIAVADVSTARMPARAQRLERAVAPVPVPALSPVAPTAAVNAPKSLDALLVAHNFRFVTEDGRVTAAESASLRATLTKLSPEAQAELSLRFQASRNLFDAGEARTAMDQFVASSGRLTAAGGRVLTGASTMARAPSSVQLKAANIGSWPAGSNQVTLNWDKNTENDLQGYRVYVGNSPGVFSHVYEVAGANASSLELSHLPKGTYFFAVTAYDTSNNESAFSPAVAKTVTQ